ncbi:competence protein ComK [Lederbergia sp. NSJ-179]|uniref:competence protein ComK n=1 Tax=Lederbergia sp. NSJ-179 TaxID=2931402 RepID=UPI001FD6270B|nr:competence protein ComK [Lederbergia sp. NSJ-179]MCJ7840392.1 competence protein ComK [Lederbergia sp. NSJ-179]
MEKELIEEYIINPFTLMIRPMAWEGQIISEIIDWEETYFSMEQPLNIIKRNCGYYGCDYNGRRNGTRQLTNITHKAPILLESHTPIYFFPTKSPLHEQCIWVAHDLVITYQKGKAATTIVEFENNQKYELPISNNSFHSQMSRTATLRIEYQKSLDRIEMYNHLKQAFILKVTENKRLYRPYK